MAKTYPDIGTFSPGDILTAATMNDVGTNLDNQRIPPMCRVKQTSGQVVYDAANATLAFNAEDFDTDAMHDNATNNSRITINTAGVYLVIASVRYTTGVSDDTRISILKNGGNVGIDERGPANTRSGMQVMGYYDLAAADYLEAQVYQNNSANTARTTDTPYTFLSAAWIGQVS
jgi:hypothetical protein